MADTARHDKAARLLELARRLGGSAEGLSMEEMTGIVGAQRRTVERMLATIEELFGPLDRLADEGNRLRYRLASGSGERAFTAPLAAELAELDHAANALAATSPERAEHLRRLGSKLRMGMREPEKRRLEVDHEGLLRAEALALRPGPEAPVPGEVLGVLREALLAGRAVSMLYSDGTSENTQGDAVPRRIKVVPWGIVFGPQGYVVGPKRGKPDPVMWRLDRIRAPRLASPGTPPDDFDLEAFASRSFMTFQEEPREIVLRFGPEALPDAARFRFHPTQTVEPLEDGGLRVRFTCGGLLQVAHHLFTWGDTVRIEAPEALRDAMRQALEASAASVR